MNKTIISKLLKIQKDLKAPKSQRNSFGNYNYRSCEDILEAVKPLLDGCVILVGDELVQIGDRYYVKATATFTDGEESISNSAFARESLDKKGMDDSQITGATSSYARKYALNGLLLIDDTKDADTMDNTDHKTVKANHSNAPKTPSTGETRHCTEHDIDVPVQIAKTGRKYAMCTAGGLKHFINSEEEQTAFQERQVDYGKDSLF